MTATRFCTGHQGDLPLSAFRPVYMRRGFVQKGPYWRDHCRECWNIRRSAPSGWLVTERAMDAMYGGRSYAR